MVSASGRHRIMWECLCDCGNTKVIYADNLRRGRSLSCGCLRSDMLSEKRKTHGASKEHLYGVWCSMKSRCYNIHTKAYKDYGGRGLTVCDEWISDYQSFKDWSLDNGYEPGKSIDRINNDMGYSPDNCRWVTDVAQANNRRSNRRYNIGDESHTLTEWADIYGINPKTLFTRIYTGMDFIEAIKQN